MAFASPLSDSAPSASVPQNILPEAAHQIVKFVTSAIHRHGMILTEVNKHHCEQWVELVARLFLYDATDAERRSTCKLIRRHHNQVFCNIEAVLNFEKLIRNTADTHSNSNHTSVSANEKETELRANWEKLSSELTTTAHRRKPKNSAHTEAPVV